MKKKLLLRKNMPDAGPSMSSDVNEVPPVTVCGA
jgi:hypothetical protein